MLCNKIILIEFIEKYGEQNAPDDGNGRIWAVLALRVIGLLMNIFSLPTETIKEGERKREGRDGIKHGKHDCNQKQIIFSLSLPFSRF